VLDAVLSGAASALSTIYGLFAFVRGQMRLATSTGGFLDIFAHDFFGYGLLRRAGEADGPYAARIKAALLAPTVTRAAMVGAILRLTGRVPVIFEPFNSGDTGGYGVACGYGAGGAYGSYAMPAQFLITVFRPTGIGTPYVGGYGSSVGGYGAGRLEYVTAAAATGAVEDAAIYATINSTRAAGVVAWTQILDGPANGVPANALLDGLGGEIFDGLGNVVVAA
jgi:hypothetical protein